MLRRDLGPVSVMGFARYKLNDAVDPAEFIAAARHWRLSFLEEQEGIGMHCLLGNQSGDYADAILATSEAAFEAMSRAHVDHAASAPLMKMLDRESIRLTKNILLGDPKAMPDGFSCIEFGTFRPKDGPFFSEDKMMAASDQIERRYLSRFNESKAHFMGKVDDNLYSEIAFVSTTGAAREICNGYVDNSDCLPLLAMFDPSSVDLDFWHLLACIIAMRMTASQQKHS